MQIKDNENLMITTGLMAIDMRAPLSPMRYTAAAATAREVIANAEEFLGADLSTFAKWGDLCRVAIEVGRDLIDQCPAEALSRFFTREEEKQILLYRSERRRRCDRRGRLAHRNNGWGYLLAE